MAIVSRQGSYSPFGSMHDKTWPIRRAIEGIFDALSKWKVTKNAWERESKREWESKSFFSEIELNLALKKNEQLGHIHQVYQYIASKNLSSVAGMSWDQAGLVQKLRPCRDRNTVLWGSYYSQGPEGLDVPLSDVCGLLLNCEIHRKSMEFQGSREILRTSGP